MPSLIFSLLSIILYITAATLILMRLKRLATGVGTDKTVLWSVWGGAIVLHAAVLYNDTLTQQGLNLSFFNALSIVAIIISTLLLASTIKRPLENLGIVLLPVAAASLAAGHLLSGTHIVASSSSPGLQLHIVVSLIAYGTLSLAALQSILLAIQDFHLHSHQPGGWIRALPPLNLMEELMFQLIGLGFVLLAVSLISGYMFLDNMFAQHMVHKTILSTAAWLVFGVLLWGRWQFGWRGRTAIQWALGGFFVLMLAYFGSKLVLELILQRLP